MVSRASLVVSSSWAHCRPRDVQQSGDERVVQWGGHERLAEQGVPPGGTQGESRDQHAPTGAGPSGEVEVEIEVGRVLDGVFEQCLQRCAQGVSVDPNGVGVEVVGGAHMYRAVRVVHRAVAGSDIQGLPAVGRAHRAGRGDVDEVAVLQIAESCFDRGVVPDPAQTQ